MLWWHTIGLLSIAGLLIAKGLRGKYIGDEPRCRKCQSKLPDSSSKTCPTCNIRLDADDIIVGNKKIQWRWILSACLVPLLWQPTIDLYRHWEGMHTEQWVSIDTIFQKAIAGDISALEELDRRINYEPPNKQDIRKIAAYAVAHHGGSPLDDVGRGWINIVDSLDFGRYLTLEEQNLIFPKYAQASITCREHVRVGDPLPIMISYDNYRNGMSGYRYWHEPVRVLIDDVIVLEGSPGAWRKRQYDWIQSSTSLLGYMLTYVSTDNIRLGAQQVQYQGVHIFNNQRYDVQINKPSWTGELVLETTVEFLPKDSEDLVTWIDRPELLSFIKWSLNVELSDPQDWGGAIRVYLDHLQSDDESTYLPVSCELLQTLPVPVAFEFFIEADSDNYPATLISSPSLFYARDYNNLVAFKPGTAFSGLYILKVPRLQTNEIHIILRGSKEVARRTIDMYQVWKGELRYGPFKLDSNQQENH